MYRVLSIERTRREPPGPHGAGGSGQCAAPQPVEAPGAGSLPLEPGRDSGRMGHRGESTEGRGPRALRYAHPGAAAAVPLESAGRERIGECACGNDGGGSASAGPPSGAQGLLKTFALALIGFYRAAISPALPSSCRFYPSCSVYAYQAVSAWGLKRGLRLTIKRLGRCRPFGPYGYDPVPEPADLPDANSTTEGTEGTKTRKTSFSVSSVSSVVTYSLRAGENSDVTRTEALL